MAKILILSLNILQMLIITAAVRSSENKNYSRHFTNFTHDDFHLPTIAKPLHYDIKLQLIDNNNFHGETNITIFLYKPTKNLSFYSHCLGINDQAITAATGNNGTIYTWVDSSYDNKTQVKNIYFNDELVPNRRYYIFIKFTGTISNAANDTEGFFKSSYIKDGKHERIWLLATFFQGIGARRVFPCWDEPALKATFKITVKHPKQYSVLSNTEAKKRTITADGSTWTCFETTPQMSPYHIAIVLYDSDSFYVAKQARNNSIIMLCPEFIQKEDAEFALDIAERVTSYLHKTQKNISWWQVPNLIHIAIPNFPLETTENNALALYRVEDVIYNPTLDTTDHKMEIARLVSRKVVHYWLGNAFSPFTWSYLWIGESLCTLLGMNALTEKRSQLRVMDYSIVKMQHDSFHLDTHSVMNPLIMNVGSNEIDTLFSFQYYLKAPLILRMVEAAMTRNIFWSNVKQYLNEEIASVNQKSFLNFWDYIQNNMKNFGLSRLIEFSLNDAMYIWTTSRGYPVLNVTRDYESGNVTVKLINSSDCASNDWYIYVSYATETKPTFIYDQPTDRAEWFKPSQKNYTFATDDIDDWIIVNLRQTGYYRVLYDNRNWQRLARFLKHCEYDQIHVLNRAQIVDDAYYMMMKGHLSFSLFMELTEFLGKQEQDYAAWYPMIKAFEYISGFFPYPESKEIQVHLENILNLALRRIKYEEKPYEHEHTKCLREETIKWACIINNWFCKSKALIQLHNYLLNPKHHKFVPGMKEWTFCNGLKNARSQIWYQVLEMWRVKRDKKILELLACSDDTDTIYNYLKLPISDSNITKMNPIDHTNSFLFIVARHARNDIILKFILNNFETVKPKQVSAVKAFAVIINYVYSKEHLDLIHKSAEFEVRKEEFEKIKSKIEVRLYQIKGQITNFERIVTTHDKKYFG